MRVCVCVSVRARKKECLYRLWSMCALSLTLPAFHVPPHSPLKGRDAPGSLDAEQDRGGEAARQATGAPEGAELSTPGPPCPLFLPNFLIFTVIAVPGTSMTAESRNCSLPPPRSSPALRFLWMLPFIKNPVVLMLPVSLNVFVRER